MAITNLTTYLAQRDLARRFTIRKDGTNTVPGQWRSLWTRAPSVTDGVTAPAAPTTSAVCNADSDGAPQQSPRRLARFFGIENYWLAPSAGTNQGNTVQLCDRLNHMGGLVGNSVAVQATNLPTAVLTRYTTGVRVMAAMEIYSSIGASAATLSVSYTNQAGVAGRTGLISYDGLPNWNWRPMALAAGDYGVRSIESVQWDALTGAAGDFGLILYVPLAMFTSRSERNRFYSYDAALNLSCCIPEIQADACLFPVFRTALSALTSTWSFEVVAGDDA